MQMATFANGCFWCTEAIFRRLKGVTQVVSGFTGGFTENPSYYDVVSGLTGHAESIQFMFDPSVISYETLVTIFFHLHDPTILNRQGYDVGTEYRSAIFYHSLEQKQQAEDIKRKLDQSHVFPAHIVTEITQAGPFYPAEKNMQEFYEKNSYVPYCQIIIDPKVQKLLQEFRTEVKDEYQKY